MSASFPASSAPFCARRKCFAGFAASSGDIVIIQDADLEYDPVDIGGVIEPIQTGKADVVYGSRFLIRRAARAQGTAAAAGGPRTNALVTWCATEIEKRFAEDLTLQALAREAGYSLFHLAHLFKRDTGLSVKQYILQRRIAEARRILLEQPALTVDAVALQVGFSDFALFNRSFKRLTGQPPTLYRKISHLNRND